MNTCRESPKKEQNQKYQLLYQKERRPGTRFLSSELALLLFTIHSVYSIPFRLNLISALYFTTIHSSNPHDPSQKLQVLIPENCEAGETFKVSVPMPTVTKSSSNKENKFTKECINALDEYSQVFDDWCQAEGE